MRLTLEGSRRLVTTGMASLPSSAHRDLQLILGEIDQRHACARLEHGARACQADAGRSARDRGHLAGKTISHLNPLYRPL